MKKLLLLLTTFILLMVPGTAFAKDWPAQTNVPLDKVWTIMFSEPVKNIDNTYKDRLLVVDFTNRTVANYVYLSTDGKTVTLVPHENYFPGEIYYLLITNNVESESGKSLTESITMKFTTAIE